MTLHDVAWTHELSYFTVIPNLRKDVYCLLQTYTSCMQAI